MKKLIILGLFPLFAAGCLSFTKAPGGTMQHAGTLESSEFEILGQAEGYSSEFRPLWFLPSFQGLSQEDAIKEAIRSRGGDGLIDVRIMKEREVYIIGTVNILRVTGKVIRYTDKTEK